MDNAFSLSNYGVIFILFPPTRMKYAHALFRFVTLIFHRDIVESDIVREANGIAMRSHNLPEEREKVSLLHKLTNCFRPLVFSLLNGAFTEDRIVLSQYLIIYDCLSIIGLGIQQKQD